MGKMNSDGGDEWRSGDGQQQVVVSRGKEDGDSP